MRPDAHSSADVSDAPERSRFEATVDDGLAGILDYKARGERITLIHTEVSPAFEGRGIAASMVRYALDDARRRDLRVIPTCSYVKSYLARHPEDLDIIVGYRPDGPSAS